MILVVSFAFFFLDIPIQAHRWTADYHHSSAPLLCAAKQGEGVVSAPRTCKQVRFTSATIQCSATALTLGISPSKPLHPGHRLSLTTMVYLPYNVSRFFLAITCSSSRAVVFVFMKSGSDSHGAISCGVNYLCKVMFLPEKQNYIIISFIKNHTMVR